MVRQLFVLNGPNLDMLGRRERHLYGSATLEDVENGCARVCRDLGWQMFFGQSNAEHDLVEWVHEAYRRSAAVVMNPAAYSFTSVAVLDALRMLQTPVVEIHLTNIHARDEIYHRSLISSVATTVIVGAGAYGYELAIRAVERLSRQTEPESVSRGPV